MKKIVLLTNEYPYNSGESFLEAELNTLPDDIVVDIIPLREMRHPSRIRPVPNNVNVRTDFLTWELFRKISSNIKALFRPEFWRAITGKHLKLKEIKNIWGFFGRAEYVANKIAEIYEAELDVGDISFYTYWFLYGALAISFLRRKHSFYFVSRAHGIDVWDDVSAFHVIPGREYMLKKINRLYVCGKAGADFLQKKYEAYSGKISYDYLGTEDYGFTTEDNRGSIFRIVSCSRIVKLKRLNLLIAALSKIHNVQLEWVHFGDGPERVSIEKQASQLESHVIVSLKGQTQHQELMEYYSTHDVNVFINLSDTEGVPVSIMEAISFGIPVIATDVGGTNEIVNTDNGSLLQKDVSADSIAAEILKYISMDSDLYVGKRECARKHWEECFSAKTNYGNFYRQFRG